jgi:hypothetical protein
VRIVFLGGWWDGCIQGTSKSTALLAVARVSSLKGRKGSPAFKQAGPLFLGESNRDAVEVVRPVCRLRSPDTDSDV